jgi:Glucodextranase, domain B/Bacterial Ig domain
MRKISILNRQRFTACLFYLFYIFLIFLLSGCGGGSDDNLSPGLSETESASFTVAWHDAPVIKASENGLITAQAEPVDCGIITNIICEVYNGSNTFLTSEVFDCSAGNGTIDNIPVGEGRVFVILGVVYGDSNEENILYHGEVPGITITAGETNNLGTIDAYPFAPILISPQSGSNVPIDNFSLNWTFVENAYEYRVLVSTNDSFGNPIINETTINTTYSPSGLLASTTYYWKVFARDIHANQGVESNEVWSFIPQESSDITPPTVEITSPTSSSSFNTNSSTVNIGGTASDNVGVTQVTWVNSRGGSGTASGTTSWSATGIALSFGTNVITVTARDEAGNTGTDILTVTRGSPPIVTITSPTTSSTYSTTGGTVNIGGTASDDVGVTQVTWTNSRGGSGICSGTTSWSAGGIDLFEGDNLITITAWDAAGNTGTDTLTATKLVPGPPVISNISYNITGLSDTCTGSGGTFTGTTYNVRFNYDDPDGDVTKDAGAKVWAGFNNTNPNFDATNFSTFSGDGFTGSNTTFLCTQNLTSINVTMQLEDGAGGLSNTLTIKVDNP